MLKRNDVSPPWRCAIRHRQVRKASDSRPSALYNKYKNHLAAKIRNKRCQLAELEARLDQEDDCRNGEGQDH